MDRQSLFLIDATAFCYRAFYALGGLATSFGQPTNAIFGFMNMLNKILKEKKPQFLAICFDVSRDTFRQKKFAEYKIQRPPMPDDLKSQMPFIKEIISAYGIAILEKEGYEADDIIATVASRAQKDGFAVTIVSSDKDILQLVDEDTLVLCPHKDEDTAYDKKKVLERFGVSPGQIADIIALMGDDADNIPGVPGIGEKTAVDLIKSFGDLEKILSNINKVKSEKIRKAISEHIEQIKLSRELAILDKDAQVDFNLEQLRTGKPDNKELFRLFKHLEFKKLLKGLPVEEDSSEVSVIRLKDSDLKELKIDDELFLYGDSPETMVFYAQDKFFQIENPGANFQAMLSNQKFKKAGYNLKRLKIALAKEKIVLEGLYFDTMVAAYLLNPAKSEYHLTDLAWDYLAKVSGQKPLTHLTALDLIRLLRPRLEEELRDKSLFSLFLDLEMPLVNVLAQMELNGIKLDLEILSSLSGEIEKKLAKLIDDIYAQAGCQFNINSPKQLREVLFEKLKLPIVKKSKTGPSTDEEVLRNLSAKHQLPKMLLEYRQLTKLKNTYVDTLPELVNPETHRVHTSFNQTATETGRLSSSNPNLQNIPIKTEIGSNIRRAIIASSCDSHLLSCDYSQIELRILAHLSGDEKLTLAFKENKDIHKATASLIYGLAEEEVTDSMREVAKRVNFGIIYGLTAYGLSRDLDIPVDQAQAFIDAYFLRYPAVKEYIQQQIAKAQAHGFVTTILGRRRYLPEINNKNQGVRQFAQRQAVNTPIQGSASDLIKLAMIHIHEQINIKKLASQMILQIHDELLFEVVKEEFNEFTRLVKEKMEQVLKLNVPISVVMKKGKNWLEMEEIQ